MSIKDGHRLWVSDTALLLCTGVLDLGVDVPESDWVGSSIECGCFRASWKGPQHNR